MSAGRNLITLFFTVNTLLHFFFSSPSPCLASTSGKRTTRAARRNANARTAASLPSKKHFFSAVFLNRCNDARRAPPRRHGGALHLAALFAACPPAENFLSGNSTSGVAHAQMRKLIAWFDRRMRVVTRWSPHAARAGSLGRRALPRATFSPGARQILTGDSRQKSDARVRRCSHRITAPWMPPSNVVALPSALDAHGRSSACTGDYPCAHPVMLAHRHLPHRAKKWPLQERPSECNRRDRLSDRRLRAARHSRRATTVR